MVVLAVVLGIFRILVAGLLLISAYGKWRQQYGLAVRDVAAYHLSGARTTEFVAFVLPLIEAVLGGSILVGRGLPVTGLLTATLFLGFAAVAFITVRRGIATECGCFGGIARQKVGTGLLLRNLLIAGILVVDAFVLPYQLVLPPTSSVLDAIGYVLVLILIVLLRFSQRAKDRRGSARAAE